VSQVKKKTFINTVLKSQQKANSNFEVLLFSIKIVNSHTHFKQEIWNDMIVTTSAKYEYLQDRP